jgi:hypothetical protein
VKTRTASQVTEGAELAPLDIPITATLVISGAIASRDYQDVHHDRDLARERGAKDIFMNILTTNGLVGRYVSDWAGPEAILKRVAIRLGVPNYPGDVMRLSGRVTAVEGGEVEIEIRGANTIGDHVTGTVRVALPEAAR